MPKVSEAYLENRRNQILDAAWACFGRRGYHETTMQDICKESGLSYGALYRYFDSKEEIMRAISERAQSEALSLVAEAQRRGAAPHEALQTLGSQVFGSINDPSCDEATKVHIETLPEVLRRPELIASLTAELGVWRAGLTKLFQEAKDGGHLSRAIDPEALSVLLMCAYEGLRIQHLLDPEHFTPELVLKAIDVLMAGVSSDAPAVPA